METPYDEEHLRDRLGIVIPTYFGPEVPEEQAYTLLHHTLAGGLVGEIRRLTYEGQPGRKIALEIRRQVLAPLSGPEPPEEIAVPRFC